MKISFLFLTALALAGTASASDVARKVGGHTVLKTNHAAACSTPSGKASRECAQTASTQTQPARHF